MSKKKVEILVHSDDTKVLPPIGQPQKENDDDYEIEIPREKNYELLITENLNPLQVNQLKKIGYYISATGLSLEDACELVRLDPEELKSLLKEHAYVGKYLRVKDIELKKNLLKIMSTQALQNKNEKWAESMLKIKYPEEYSDSKKKGGDEATKMMGLMLETIRGGNQENTLVEKKSLVMINTGAGMAGVEIGTEEGKNKKKAVERQVQELLK